MSLAQAYILLAIAIAGEIISTGTLKATEGFTKFVPSLNTTDVEIIAKKTSLDPEIAAFNLVIPDSIFL